MTLQQVLKRHSRDPISSQTRDHDILNAAIFILATLPSPGSEQNGMTLFVLHAWHLYQKMLSVTDSIFRHFVLAKLLISNTEADLGRLENSHNQSD